MEKMVVIGLIGVFATLSSADIAARADDILQEATAVASVHQERELMTALELYHLKHGTYPTVEDDEVVDELFAAGMLRGDDVVYEVAYESFASGQKYELSVS